MHLNSKLLFEKYAIDFFKNGNKVLEIGPAGFPSVYSKVVSNNTLQWHTLDIGEGYIDKGELNPLHILSNDEYHYPIEDNTFDIVLAGQVMEHVKSIWRWVEELKRIIKPGGYIILVSPVSWAYHEAPVDCWRIYPEGMKTLMEEKGLQIIVNLFKSLEKEKHLSQVETIPGNSFFDLDGNLPRDLKSKIRMNKFISGIPYFKRFSFPIQVAYDNICIAQK
jgi:SAM-dependent methyltransferase